MEIKTYIPIIFIILIASPAMATGSLVGNWTLNQGTGIYANDSSGFNNNGTITGATWHTDIVNSTALNFSLGNVVTIPSNSSLNVTNITISAWIKPYIFNPSFSNKILYKSDNTYGLRLVTDGTIQFVINGNTLGNTTLPLNTWSHIFAQYDNSTMRIYLNNVLVDSTSNTGDINNDTSNLVIGDVTQSFNGTIDEVKMWNYSINASERTTEYQRFHPVPAYLTGGQIITATYPPQTTSVNFSWHDTEYPGDRLQVAIDSSFNVIVVDTTTSNDYYLATLPSGDTYYWKVRQYNGTTGTYGNTSQTVNFSITSASSATGQGVQGIVYEIINGQITPINEAQVYIYNSTYSNFMITGSNGYYLFDGLGNDTYQVYAVKQDYDTTAALPVNVNGSLATQNILMKKFISPYIPNFVYEKFIVRGLFDDAYPGVTVNVYVGDELTVSQTGTTDSMGQVVFRLFKDQKYRVTFSGGGIGSDITVTIYAKEESYLVRIMSGFPTGGDRNTDITSNLTSRTINATWSNLSLIYNDTRSSTSIVWLYVRNLSTNTTCYVSSTSNNITMGCPVIASGKYQFGFNATSSVYGFFKQDKIINFDVGKPATPAIDTNIDQTLLQWASIILIVLTAALFSVKTVKFGAVIVPLEALVLWAFGWFEPAGGNAVASLLLLSCAVCLGIMVYLRQSESKAVYQ